MQLAGIDIGTTSICGVLLNAADKKVLRRLTRDNDSALPSKNRWEHLQDPGRIMRTAGDILAELKGQGGAIQAVGFTGQMHGILYTDAGGDAVSPLYTWQDERGEQPFSHDITYAGQLGRMTGYPVASGFGMATHHYNALNGLVPEKAAALCTIADYAAMRLAGRTKPVLDATNAAGLGLFDLKSLRFDEAALGAAAIDTGVLPDLVRSGTVIGHTVDGIPVVCALGDNQAAFLGSVTDVRSEFLLNIGTGAQVSAYTERFRHVDKLDTRPYPGGGYLLVGASLGGGKSYAMLERFFRDVCAAFGRPADGNLYEIMNRHAEQAWQEHAWQEHASMEVDTRFFGTRDNPQQRGAIGNIGPDNWTPRHLAAGFLEGMAGELLQLYRAIPDEMKAHYTAVAAAGNGIRRNEALQRLLGIRFGMPVHLPEHPEEAAVGAAICAGVGCGIYRDFKGL